MVVVTDYAGGVGCETKAKAGGTRHAQASVQAGADKQWEARSPPIRFVLLFFSPFCFYMNTFIQRNLRKMTLDLLLHAKI